MGTKDKDQIFAEAMDYLQRKLEKLEEEKDRLTKEIKETEELLEKMPKIYGK